MHHTEQTKLLLRCHASRPQACPHSLRFLQYSLVGDVVMVASSIQRPQKVGDFGQETILGAYAWRSVLGYQR